MSLAPQRGERAPRRARPNKQGRAPARRLGPRAARWRIERDPGVHALLHALVAHTGARVGLLIDEAHNLVDRARAMYSTELRESQLHRGAESLPKRLKPVVNALLQQFDELDQRHIQEPAASGGRPMSLARVAGEGGPSAKPMVG